MAANKDFGIDRRDGCGRTASLEKEHVTQHCVGNGCVYAVDPVFLLKWVLLRNLGFRFSVGLRLTVRADGTKLIGKVFYLLPLEINKKRGIRLWKRKTSIGQT